MHTNEHRAATDHRPIDAETVLFNALADSLTLGPFNWDEDRLATKEKEEELEDMVAHILASLLQYYQMTADPQPHIRPARHTRLGGV